MNEASRKILILEAFYGGSHKQLVDYLLNILQEDGQQNVHFISMTDKKWHWRSRTSALYFAEQIKHTSQNYSSLFVSSTTNLTELIGLRPDLISCRKILYFHENQLIYPVRKHQERDFQYGYNQILSCLTADIILFNSKFNMTSFLTNINSYLKVMPDYRPKNIVEQIEPKCQVVYFPLNITLPMNCVADVDRESQLLHIVWSHRWEHDKNPTSFFDVIVRLHNEGYQFRVSVLGQCYTDIPDIFVQAQELLKDHIYKWGYQEEKQDYIDVLKTADVALSTANHEFFGVSMLEAVSCGCYPLCPKRLVYPEIFNDEYLYNTDQQMYKRLKYFCQHPNVVRKHEIEVDLSRFDGKKLRSKYLEFFR